MKKETKWNWLRKGHELNTMQCLTTTKTNELEINCDRNEKCDIRESMVGEKQKQKKRSTHQLLVCRFVSFLSVVVWLWA